MIRVIARKFSTWFLRSSKSRVCRATLAYAQDPVFALRTAATGIDRRCVGENARAIVSPRAFSHTPYRL